MVLDMLAMDMALDTTDMALDTTARGLLMPKLIPTTMVDTMGDMVLDMLAMDMALDTTDMALDTTARGLLMPRLIPTTMVDTMVDMVLDMPAMDMALDTTDMGVDTTADTDMVLATMAMDVVFMATTDKSTNPYLFPDLLQPRDLIKYQDLSVNQVLSPRHQNGLYHWSSPPPVLPVSVLCQSSLTRNGQQEAENQNVMIFLK